MFNILTIGDPHFKADNGETTEELTEKTCKLIRDRIDEIDAVCVLGDILHRHEKIDLHPFHRAMQFLEGIYEALGDNKFLYILIGNHDRSNNRVFMTDEHVFNPIKLWPNTFVADKAMIHSPRKDFKVLLMPYVPPGRFQEAYESVISESDLEKTIDIVLAHQEFHGAKMNLITSNEGDPWNSLKPLCVSGHIHDYQVLKSNLIYTGTPIQHGYADVGKKTMSIYKFDSRREYTEERIDLKIRGRITMKCAVKDFNSLVIPIDEYFVKVKIHGIKREIKSFMESQDYKAAIKSGVVFQFLELPTVEIIKDVEKEESGIKFSTRVKELLESVPQETRDVFDEIFNKC